MESAISLSAKFIHFSPPIPIRPEQIHPISKIDNLELKAIMSRSTNDLVYLETLDSLLKNLSQEIGDRKKEYQVHVEDIRRRLEASDPSINDLPVELLQSIFRYAIHDWKTERAPGRPIQFNSGIWSLSWVCRQWRATIHSDIVLWSTIPPINILKEFISANDRQILETYFRRSQPAPLTVDFTASPHQSKIPLSLLAIISRHISRIHELTVQIPLHRLESFFRQPSELSPSHNGFQKLKTLRLAFVQVGPATPAKFPPLLQQLPVLERLELKFTESFFTTMIPLLDFPWNQLTSLTLTETASSLASVFQILPRAKCLHHLELIRSIGWGDADQDPATATTYWGHPELQSVYMDGDVSCVLSTMHFVPRLEEFTITNVGSDILKDGFLRFGSTLTRCTLPNRHAPLRELLPLVPGLQMLTLLDGIEDVDLITLFARPYSTDTCWLVPLLESLIIHEPSIRDPINLEQTIQARKSGSGVAPFKRIELVHTLNPWLVSQPSVDRSFLSNPVAYRSNIITTTGCSFIFYRRKADYALIRIGDVRGYEVNVVDLEEFCTYLERDTTDSNRGFHTSRIFRINTDPITPQILLELVIRLIHFLELIEPGRAVYQRIDKCKERIICMMRILLHDPWPFQIPPIEWTRFNEQRKRIIGAGFDYVHMVLVYTPS